MAHGILIHETIDDVGVAVRDLHAGEEAGVVTLEGQEHGKLALTQDVPLGHKVAMRDIDWEAYITKNRSMLKSKGRFYGRNQYPPTNTYCT